MDPAHPELKGKIGSFFVMDRHGQIQRLTQPRDTGTHGTRSARILCKGAGSTEIRFHTVAHTGGKIILNLLLGMDTLLDCDIQIACLPIGIPDKTPVFAGMIEAFHQKGVLVVVPSGNQGEGTVHAPGSYPGVLTVGAVDESGNVLSVSGSEQDADGNCLKPDVLAPGVFHLLDKSGQNMKRVEGTSFACAYVAGVAARLLAAKSSATPEEIKTALLNTAQPLPANQRHRCRTGIIQPDAALESLSQRSRYQGGG